MWPTSASCVARLAYNPAVDLSFDTDDNGHLVCRLSAAGQQTLVSAATVADAAADLLAAAESAVAPLGFGECEWWGPNGSYRWMLKRSGHALTVAVMWSAGTITGYQHVFREECDANWFVERVQAEAGRVVAGRPFTAE